MTILRPASTSDAHAIARIHVAGWQSAYRGILADEHLDSISIDQRQAFWKQQLHHDGCLLFVVDDPRHGVTGFAFAGPHHGNLNQYRGEIHAIYVLEQFQRRGLGQQLFRHTVAALREARYRNMMVWALKQNPYRQFYERLGGQIVGEELTCIGGRELLQVAYGWNDLATLPAQEAA
jgi:GNAT superfamily N-acetyltransferase